LADATRLRVACALHDGGELCGCDLAWITGRSQAIVSHHVKALKHAGLVRSRREGKLVMHALTPAGEQLLAAVRETEPVAA
ncbi:MAG: winged helix-turn-helix transcriptional regulator, partial [Solirubrobacterales bacterium]|nr:winged helix-turn-helix transcriptional regulator [Solirubrobacterales bacterium]